MSESQPGGKKLAPLNKQRSSARWRPGSYLIASPTGSPVGREGFVRGCFGVHRDFTHGWSVTHLLSGYAACYTPTREDAQRVADRLSKLRGWASVRVSPSYSWIGSKRLRDKSAAIVKAMRAMGWKDVI